MIYLDAAATTFQKPAAVARAVDRAFSAMTTPGRGGYRAAELAAETVFQCRSEAAALFRVPSEEQVILTSNATHGLNIAIKSLVSPGDTVVVSGYEHNAVMRPLYGIGNVRIKVASALAFDQDAMVRAFDRLLTQEVRAAVCTHVSNVCGYILPVEQIAALCRSRGVPLIIDASQSAGVLPVDLQGSGAAFIGMPGHKGLYGPQGTGILLCAGDGAKPLLEGGTGSMSALREMPPFLPDRLEAGTQNIPGIAGLLEGIRFVRRMGTETIAVRERRLIQRLIAGMKPVREVQLLAAENPDWQAGVLSFLIDGMDCEEVAACFAQKDVALRAGLHCAPLAHKTLGTLERGTLRVSVSAFSQDWEIEAFLEVLQEILQRKNG